MPRDLHANAGVMILSRVVESSYLNNEECIHHCSVLHGKLKKKQEKYHKLMLVMVNDKQTHRAREISIC